MYFMYVLITWNLSPAQQQVNNRPAKHIWRHVKADLWLQPLLCIDYIHNQ